MTIAPGFLKDISPASRALFDEKVPLKKLAAGSPVLHRGAQAGGAFIVLEGRLRVYSISPGGGEATLYSLRPGETCVLALNCLFQDLRYPAWVRAEVRSRVAIVPGPIFRHLFDAEPAIRDLTIQALGTAVFQLMAELESIHFVRLDQRLINLILLNANHGGTLKMTQQQMAHHLGVTREAVARVLQVFVRDGLVRTRRGALDLLDSGELARRLEHTE